MTTTVHRHRRLHWRIVVHGEAQPTCCARNRRNELRSAPLQKRRGERVEKYALPRTEATKRSPQPTFPFFILLSLFALSLGLSWRAGVKLVVSAHKESNTTQHSGYIKAERSRKKKEKTK
jgi:hypothetical protein